MPATVGVPVSAPEEASNAIPTGRTPDSEKLNGEDPSEAEKVLAYLAPTVPAARVGGNRANVRLSRIETLSVPMVATARSGLPSPSKSPTPSDTGPHPTPKLVGCPKEPSPFPRRIETTL